MVMSKFIQIKKDLYQTYKNKPWPCHSLQQPVYFTAKGIHHLLYRKRRPRKKAEKHYRLRLIPILPTVIEKSETAVRRIQSKENRTFTWSLKYTVKINGRWQVIKVILYKK